MNYALAPRKRTCFVCQNVAHPEDVTVRLINEDGTHLPLKDAIAYMRGIGQTVTPRRLTAHRDHVRKSTERTGLSPVNRAVEVIPKETVVTPGWLRAPDQAIDLGMGAMDLLNRDIDDLSPAELIQLARLSLSAASKVGDWHAKGRQMGQADRVIDLLFEISRPNEG